MDPWAVVSADSSEPVLVNRPEGTQPSLLDDKPVSQEPADLAPAHDSSDSKGNNIFEDHFIPPVPVPGSEGFQKLPDTHVYLASLEKKLEKIQKGKEKPGALLESLQKTRDSYMVTLLAENNLSNSSEPLDFDELKVNPILKKLVPEKQAIAVEELVHLVRADQLSGSVDLDLEEDSKTGVPQPAEQSKSEVETPVTE